MKRFLMSCLAALAALAAKAEEPFAAFVKAESGESAAVRLEARTNSTVAAWVVTGTVPMISPSGVVGAAWDTTQVANGWQEVRADGEDAVATQLLVLNAPEYKVEGGRITANTSWSANAVHWVRNWVVVPSGVTLTVKEGTVVKFGEQTGIKVENGGTVDFQGKSDSRIVLTHFADDVYGGDSDFGKTNASYGAWSVTAVAGGTINDTYTHVRYGKIESLPTISMPASVTAQRVEGKARIPVTLSGTRSNRMSLHWRTIDGTAKFGTDFSKNEDEAIWSNTSVETVYFEIPLIKTTDDDEVRTFRVEVLSTEDVNPNPERLVTTVTIISGTSVPIAKCVESDESAAIRLENRKADAVGRALVHCVELKASDPDSAAVAWDTTKEPEGWQTITDAQERVPPVKVLVRNDAKVAIEGGRLTANTRWDSSAVHLVRNRVIVPADVTLTIGEGAIVKFCEQTGIKVEDGGALVTEGKEKNRAVLTAIADDEFGGDSDLQEAQPVNNSWSIETVGSGAVSDVYTYVRYGTVSTLPTISMPTSATAQRSDGKVRIPVTLSGTRANRMSIHWRAVDGTAKFGVDYSEKEGEAYWANTSTTTVYFEIPIIKENESEEVKTFDVELVSAEDINIDPLRLVTKVMIVSGSAVPVAKCVESEASAPVRLEARLVETVGRALVRGVELKAPAPTEAAATWDTTLEPEGWNTLTATSGEPPATAKVLVRNAADIAFEGGRLEANAKWTSDAVHIVRNMVVVPSGITLTVAEGTVVKFAETTGIKVEDGGKLSLEGKDKARSVLTSLADDEFGGDTDLVETNGVYGSWSVETVGSGEVSDVYTYIRYGTIAPLPTISMPVSATAQRTDGKVRIPVTFSGTRSNRVAIHWRTNDGTAKYGVDFPENAGEAVWANTSTTTVFLEIPITKECETDEVRTFQVELVSAEDINIDPSRLVTTVTIVSGAKVPMPTCAVSESSEAMRMEARSTNSLGRAAVVGTEWKAKDGGSRAEAWDTTPLGYGWQTLEDGHGTNAQVLALNDAKIGVEGGRLTENATWESNVVHVVRNTVVVPSGITLTVLTNAVVKFCENTGVKVEVGGSLIVIGSKDEPAIFTPLADDTAGGDTDKRETSVRHGEYVIDVVSGGTFSDSFAAFRHIVVPAHATLSLPQKCEINESEKQVQIPVTLSGSRTTPFRAFWRVIDGTAKYPDDYPTRTGVVEWNSTSDGTRFITVPVNDDGVAEETENFTVELYDAQGANISASAYACVVTVRDSTATAVPYPTCAESPASEAIRLDNRSEGMLGKAVVKGVEYRAAGTDVAATAWDTTAEPEGWQTLTASDVPALTARVLVRNDAKIAVEGGRLTASTVWDSNLVHLVRHTVVVPSGVTLSVTTNAVVKFCENTGVKVEAGGRFQLLGSLDENVYMTLANDDTVGGDTDKDEEREWVEGAATYSVNVVSGGTFTDMNSVIRGTTIGSFGYASVNAKTVVDATEGVIRIPVFVNGSRTTQFSVDWKTSDGLRGQLIWDNVNEGTKWVTLNVADCSEKFTFELCECRGINIDGAAKVSEVTVFKNATPLAVCAESESSAAVRFENRADNTFGKALCFGREWKSADGDNRAEAWDTTQEDNDWINLGEGVNLLVRNDTGLAVEGGRLMPTYEVVNTNGVEVTNWNYSVNWTSDKVHIVRNWVVVPNEMTLSIAAGTVVKFAEFTGFKVEAGGRLCVEGTVDAPVVYTAVADDTIGGDTDKREAEPQYGDYSIDIISGGTYSDRNCAVRYATFSNLGTATLPASAVANEKDGVVRVPMFISTSRTTAFCVDWRVASGTYATKGRLNWNTYTEGTKYIEIPLTSGTVKGEFDTFEIEMYESQGINVSTTERKCVVTIYPDKTFPEEIVCADSDESAAVRLENRDPLWSYGAEIVCGTELKSENGESRAEPWDTTQENEGWYDVRNDGASPSDPAEFQLLVRNDPTLAIEGGRLIPTYSVRTTNGVEVTNWNYSVTWNKDKVHVVRNWVVVPNGVTLTIAAGTVVKFCDETGIKVEAGGRLVSAGTAAADVILTSINDDTVGGDTDFDDVEPEHGDYWINVISGGTFTDTYTQMRYGESGTFGSVSIPEEVVAKKDGGVVRIPLTISASRTTPFSVDWVAHDGTAVYGEDYLCASGRIDWTSSSQGTKYLEIPLDRMAPTAEDEWFEVELITGLGINLNLNSTLCFVDLYDSRESLVGDLEGYAESEWCSFASFDSNAGRLPKFVTEVEKITYSTAWSTNGSSATVTIADAEKNIQELKSVDAPDESFFGWSPGGYEDGRYDFTHKILNDAGKTIKVDSSVFIVNRNVVTHGGRLVTNETWAADKVHLVTTTVTVPSGVALTIVPDAIVKFMPGTEIIVEDGGLGICRGAIITHAYDDAMGGDIFFDGADQVPSDGAYELSGEWEDDETTQYRYSAPVEVSGTIKTSMTWPGHKTYVVTGNITINNGATLTIDPGAVVKFKGGLRLSVSSGGTLIAEGTRSQPIVFTSIKDDEHGGDTNGDGGQSLPQAGDWRQITASGGKLTLNHVKVFYCSSDNNQGGLYLTGGTVMIRNSTVAHCLYDCIRTTGAQAQIENSIFMDSSMGAAPSGGWTKFINCIFADLTTGVRWPNGEFRNCIFARNAEFVDMSFGTGGLVFDHCCFWNPTDFNPQSCSYVGKNGNIWGDPKFIDMDNDDFRIGEGSACIDAADGTVALEVDGFNQPRQNIEGVTPTGVADQNGKYPDIGLYEYQPRFAGSDVDLAVKSVSVSSDLTVGEMTEVSWRVTNVGSADAEGPWSDKVELVASDGTVSLMGAYLVKGGIVAGGERTVNASFRVPSAAEGVGKIRVTTNYGRDVYEGALTANNIGMSTEMTVKLSSVDFGEDAAAKLKIVPGGRVSYAVAGLPTNGGSILIHSASGDAVLAYVSFGRVPTGYVSDSSAVVLPNGDVLLSVPAHGADQSAYLMIETGAEALGTSVDVTVSDAYPAIYALSKSSMPNTGTQSLAVYGVGLDNVLSVDLVSESATLRGDSVRSASASELSASFNLTDAKAGSYRAVVTTRDGQTATSVDIVSVIPNTTAKANLEISLQAPSAIRPNRWYEAILTVKNTGDADAMIPIVVLNGSGLEFKDPDGGKDLYDGIIHVLPMGKSTNPLVIQPGEDNRVRLLFRQNAQLTDAGSATVNYSMLPIQDADWGSLIAKGKLDDDAWQSYRDAYVSGFADAQEFLMKVLEKAAAISDNSFRSVNALRLYELVQYELKNGLTGVVRGVLINEDYSPVSGVCIGAGVSSIEKVSYATTGKDGTFVIYSVPTGVLAFVSNEGIVVGDQIHTLHPSGLSGLVLCLEQLKEDMQEDKPRGTAYNLFEVLPFDARYAMWEDNGVLYVGKTDDKDNVKKVSFDGGVISLRCCELDDNNGIIAGVIERGATNFLFACGVNIGEDGLTVDPYDVVADEVDGLSSAYCTGLGRATLIYRRSGSDGVTAGWYETEITEQNVSNHRKLMNKRLLSAAVGSTDVDFDISDFPSLGTLGFDVKGLSLGVGGWMNFYGDGIKSSGCCKWGATYGSDLRGGFDVSVGKRGVAFAGSVRTDDNESYYCLRSFDHVNGDCLDSHKVLVSAERTKERRLSLEYKHTFLSTSELFNALPAAKLMKVKDLPLSVDVYGSIKGTIAYDTTEVVRNYPGEARYRAQDDNVGLNLHGKIAADVSLKWDSWEGDEKRRSSKYGRDWSFDTGMKPVEASGDLSVSVVGHRHSVGGNAKWNFSMDGTGSIEARILCLSAKAQLMADKTGLWWEWQYDLLFWEDIDVGKFGNSKKLSQRAFFAEERDAMMGRLVLQDPVSSSGVRFATWDVQRLSLNEKSGYVYCREYGLDHRIRRGVFFKEDGGSVDELLCNSKEDVSHMRAVRFDNGKLALVYLTCRPDFSGDAVDLLASYGKTRLCVRWFENGEWSDAIQIGTENDSAEINFACNVSGDFCVVVWSGLKTATEGEKIDSEVNTCLLDANEDRICGYGKLYSSKNGQLELVSASCGFVGGQPLAYWVLGGGDDDVIMGAAYDMDANAWRNVNVSSNGGANVLFANGAVNKTANSARIQTLASTGDQCSKGCFCHCQGDEPRPRPGCGCKKDCPKCKQNCGENCKCGKSQEMTVPHSCDPNEMAGPTGVGEKRYVKPGEWMNYTIYFENQSNATASAQDVWVTLPKDEGLDWETFELGEVVFGNNIDPGLSGQHSGPSDFAIPGTNWSVHTEIEHTKDSVIWHLRVIDPTTVDNYPADPYAGFLPPNDETGRGEGHLGFRVKVKSDAPTGSTINASATIVFDTNDPITTDPAWWNTVGEIRTLTLALDDETTTNLTLVAGEKFGELPVPTRNGYAFKGWFFGPNGTGGEITADTLVPSGLENIYADWEATDSVIIWVDGVKNVRHWDEVANFTTEASVTNGYTNVVCVGWVGTGDVPAAGTSNAVTFTVTQESTLRWLYETNYWVSATAVGPRGARILPAGGNVTLKDAAGVALPTNELWAAAGTNLTAEATADEGSAFARWVDAETGEEIVEAGAELGQRRALTLPVKRPWLVWAEFTNLTFAVRFELGEHGSRTGGGELEQTVAWGEPAIAPTVAAADGYAFTGWSAAFDRIVSNVVVTAQYAAGGYAIIYENTMGCFNPNPLAYAVEDAVTFSALTNPPGWRFVGWMPTEIVRGSTGDTNVVAQWEQIKYVVDIDGVIGSDYVYGQEVTASTIASVTNGCTNLVCVGWVGTGDVPAAGTSNAVAFVVTQESTLRWLYETNYWVSATAGDGGRVTLKDAAGVALPTNELWAAAGTNLTAEATADEGHVFARWVDAETGAELGQRGALTLPVDRPWIVQAEFTNLVQDVVIEEPSGRYFKADLEEDLGVEIPTNVSYAAGDKVTVKVEGLPKGLKLTQDKKTGDWILSGVPTEAVDLETQPMYARVTVTYKDKTKGEKGKVELLQPLALSVVPAKVRPLAAGVLNQAYGPADIATLWPAVADAKENPKEWSFKGWPAGIKYRDGEVSGSPTKAGEYAITATHKHKIDGKAVSETYSAVLTVWGNDGASKFRTVDQAYVPTTAKALTDAKSVNGLPAGIKFNKATGGLSGTPTKPGVFAVTVTKTDNTKETFLWKVKPGENDGVLGGIGWETEGSLVTVKQGVVQGWSVEMPEGAKVTASGLPAGLKLVQDKQKETWSIAGTPTKAGNFVVTFKTVRNGVTITERISVIVEPNEWTGTWYGVQKDDCEAASLNAVVTVSANGTVKLVFSEGKDKKTVKTTVSVKNLAADGKTATLEVLQRTFAVDFENGTLTADGQTVMDLCDVAPETSAKAVTTFVLDEVLLGETNTYAYVTATYNEKKGKFALSGKLWDGTKVKGTTCALDKATPSGGHCLAPVLLTDKDKNVVYLELSDDGSYARVLENGTRLSIGRDGTTPRSAGFAAAELKSQKFNMLSDATQLVVDAASFPRPLALEEKNRTASVSAQGLVKFTITGEDGWKWACELLPVDNGGETQFRGIATGTKKGEKQACSVWAVK